MLRSMWVSAGGDIQLVTHREHVLLDVQGVHWVAGPRPRIRDHSTIDLTLAEAARLNALLSAAIEGAGWVAAPDTAHASSMRFLRGSRGGADNGPTLMRRPVAGAEQFAVRWRGISLAARTRTLAEARLAAERLDRANGRIGARIYAMSPAGRNVLVPADFEETPPS